MEFDINVFKVTVFLCGQGYIRVLEPTNTASTVVKMGVHVNTPVGP